MRAWPLRGAATAAARGGGRAPAEGSGWGAARAGRGARGGQGTLAAAATASRRAAGGGGPGARPASALSPGSAGTSRRLHRRGGTARFAEGVKCLKYGGGSESPRTPPPPTHTRSLPPARGRRSFSRYLPSPSGSPEHSSAAPEPPRWPPRCPPGCGWKLERKPESCPLRRRSFPQPRARTRSVRGKPLPGALQAPA